MTYSEIVDYVADRLNLKSDDQKARVGTSVNMRHREIISSLGVSQVTEQTTATATTTISSRYLTFGPSPVAVVKILAVYNTALGTYPPPILDEVSTDELLSMGVGADPPTHYAVTNMGERTVTIKLNSIPATAYVLTADVEGNATQLSGAQSPQFSEDYHDILVNLVLADELEKAEKYDKAAAKLKQAETRMGVFRLFIAKSAYKETRQGSRANSSSGASGGGGAVSGWPAITSPNLPLAIGDLLVATATTAVGSLADVAVGRVLVSGGVGAAPVWSTSPALTAVTLTTPLAPTSGGTGLAAYAVGDLLYASTTTVLSALADVAAGAVLASGGVGVAPAWTTSPTLTKVLVGDGSSGTPSLAYSGQSTLGYYRVTTDVLGLTSSVSTANFCWNMSNVGGQFVLTQTGQIGWTATGSSLNAPDTIILRDAANTLAQRNGTNPQTFRVYGTYTDASNYERASFLWSGSTFFLATEAAGTGTRRSFVFDGAGYLFRDAGTSRWSIDHTTGAFLGFSPSGGLGYTTGAGGAVTQLTSKATTVLLNTVTGTVTTFNDALAAATIVSFTFTNSAIAATDVLILNHKSGGTLGAYTLNASCGAGSATIYLRNNTAGSLSEALVLSFALIKGVTS